MTGIRTRSTLFAGIVVALTEIAIGPSAHAQDVDLLCNPVSDDEDSIKRSNLPIHLHLGDKNEMTFWDYAKPDSVSAASTQIYFEWSERHADGQKRYGSLNRQTGRIAVWEYHHFEIAECLPIKRLF